MKMVFLQQNAIKQIENLTCLSGLVTLNLSNNLIKEVSGLAGLSLLQNLDLSGNAIDSIDDCEELKELPSLSHLDMKNNHIDDREKIMPFFVNIQSLRALYLKGNPCQRHMSMYRKNLTANLKNLNYLDDRPVFESERIFADAWLRGGAEAEREARKAYADAA